MPPIRDGYTRDLLTRAFKPKTRSGWIEWGIHLVILMGLWWVVYGQFRAMDELNKVVLLIIASLATTGTFAAVRIGQAAHAIHRDDWKTIRDLEDALKKQAAAVKGRQKDRRIAEGVLRFWQDGVELTNAQVVNKTAYNAWKASYRLWEQRAAAGMRSLGCDVFEINGIEHVGSPTPMLTGYPRWGKNLARLHIQLTHLDDVIRQRKP